ncbi:MAG: hypothetical protein K0S00_3602 [Xanthobacteraceae bacterium]|nr:hypothetical protein [Xanthobacteraceae bacterium]
MSEVPTPETPAASPAPRRRWLRLGGVLLLALIVALLAGFGVFVAGLQGREAQTTRRADGIVVLTGGAERITDATNLLVEGRGTRLLITGVHPDTTLAEIGRTVPATRESLECCVELGRAALNTRGNAIETAEWAREHRFRSLLVVTSAWHMPRALVELRRALPDVELVPYPVVPKRGPEGWEASLANVRLLFVEYVKFIGAWMGVRSWPALSTQLGEGRTAAP